MSVRRKDVLVFLTNVIGKNLDASRTEEFIVSLFDLNKNVVGTLDKQETYFIRKRLGILDDGVMKNYNEISFAMNLSESNVYNLEIVILKKIKKDLDVGYKNILISSLDFSVKAIGCLKDKAINTLGDLLDRSIDELNRICYMNKQTVLEIIDKVHRMGYLFRDEIDFSIRKDISFYDEHIVPFLDNGREIYNFEYMNNSLLICNIDSKTKIRTYIFDEEILKSIFLDELLKKISSFILINNDGKKVIEDNFKKYIENIQISKKNKIQNIVRKEFSSDKINQNDDFDLINGFYDYLKELYSDNLINVFSNYLDFDKFRVCNFGEYYNLVNFYKRVISFLELEKYEIDNEKNSLNKEKINDIVKYKKIILEEKDNLLLNMSNDYLKYAGDDDFIKASSVFVNKLFLDVDLLLENNGDNISMSDVFCEISPEMIERDFYLLFNPIEGNTDIPFMVKFNNLVLKYCNKDNGVKYTEKDIIDFLINKYVVYTMSFSNSIDVLIDYINSDVGSKNIRQ